VAAETRPGSRLVDTLLWASTLALLVMSFVLSWGPPPRFGPRFDFMDKVWHFAGYGAFCGTLLLAAVWRPGRGDGRFPRAGLRAAVLVVVVAWLTEALQRPFGRDVDLMDAVADLAGVAVIWASWTWLQRLPRRRLRARL
jgi:VanZ family protein